MRKFYLALSKCATVSHKLTWSHYIYKGLYKGIDPNTAPRYMKYIPV